MFNAKIGYHGSTWGRDGLLKAVEEISEIGYRGFETLGEFYNIYDNYKGRINDFKEILAKHGLQLASFYCEGVKERGKIQEGIKRMVDIANFLKENGSDIIIMACGHGYPYENFKEMVETVEEVAKRCSDIGMKVCCHPHLDTMVETREEISMLMDSTKHIYMCADTAHLLAGGSDPVEVISTYIDRVKYLHFKDFNPEKEKDLARYSESNGMLAIFSELGNGKVNFPRILDVLKEGNYDGWLMVELDSSTRPPKESAMISKQYLEELGIKI